MQTTYFRPLKHSILARTIQASIKQRM